MISDGGYKLNGTTAYLEPCEGEAASASPSHNHTLHPWHRSILDLHPRNKIKSALSLDLRLVLRFGLGLARSPSFRRELGLDDNRLDGFLGVICVLDHGGVMNGVVVGGALHAPQCGWCGGYGEGGDAEGEKGSQEEGENDGHLDSSSV